MTAYRFSIALFAHNEEYGIARALDSICNALPSRSDWKVFVLANGCTDRTLDRVCQYREHCPQVIPVLIPLGDKSNAFNIYIQHLADDSPYHFFMDGDIEAGPGSLVAMLNSMESNPTQAAIAGMPLSGRNRAKYIRMIVEWRWLFGGLYLVRRENIDRMRQANIRLPLGLGPEDHFVSKILAAASLEPYEFDGSRIGYVEGAGYRFDSLSPFSIRDWRIYLHRLVRYRLAHHQIKKLDKLPLGSLPQTMDDTNQQILSDLEASSLPLTDWVGRAVKRWLRRQYPTPDSRYYAARHSVESFEIIGELSKCSRNAAEPSLRVSESR